MAKNIPFLFADNLRVNIPGRARPILSVSGFGVEKGRCLFILGENGAGKTTLLSALAGYLVPDSGDISLNGHKVKPLSERLVPGFAGIERVEQTPQANPFLTVSENLEKSLRSLPDKEANRRYKSLVSLCHLKKLLEQKTGSLSGGEMRRLSLALSLAHNPEVLLLDEPFAELDAQTRLEFLQILLAIKSTSHCALILVSHQAQEAQWIADEIRVLKNGKWAESLHKKEGQFRPKSILAARLLGYSNLVRVSDLQQPEGLEGKTGVSWVHIPPNSISFKSEVKHLSMGEFRLVQSYFDGERWHSLWKRDQLLIQVSGSTKPENENAELVADDRRFLPFS